MPGILFFALFFLPESPRWLAARGQTAQAEKSLTWLRPGPAHWSVAAELAEMEAALAAEAQLQTSIGLLDLVRNPIDRRRTTIAVLGLTTQAASGAMFLICKPSPPPSPNWYKGSLTPPIQPTEPTSSPWPTSAMPSPTPAS